MFRFLSLDCWVGTLRCKADQTHNMYVSTQETIRSHVPRSFGAERHATSATAVAEEVLQMKHSRMQRSIVDARDFRSARGNRRKEG